MAQNIKGLRVKGPKYQGFEGPQLENEEVKEIPATQSKESPGWLLIVEMIPC